MSVEIYIFFPSLLAQVLLFPIKVDIIRGPLHIQTINFIVFIFFEVYFDILFRYFELYIEYCCGNLEKFNFHVGKKF